MSAATRELAVDSWMEYFDSIARDLEGLLVTVEVMSEELGDQTDIERLPLQTLGFDPKDNALEIAVGGQGTRYPVVFRHFIYDPRAISVDEFDGRPLAILVRDADGAQTLVRLFEPEMLEA
jgi:hypothetical protein